MQFVALPHKVFQPDNFAKAVGALRERYHESLAVCSSSHTMTYPLTPFGYSVHPPGL